MEVLQTVVAMSVVHNGVVVAVSYGVGAMKCGDIISLQIFAHQEATAIRTTCKTHPFTACPTCHFKYTLPV
jgi:hypothetical protein